MNIVSITNAQRANALLSPAQTDPARQAFAKAETRLGQQQQATEARISTLGQIKSAVSRVNDAAKSIATSTPATAPAETKKNLQALVTAYNDTQKASTKAGPGTAQAAANDLRRALSSDASRADLRALGITQNQGGTLTFDTKAFDAAQQANPAATQTAASRVAVTTQQTASQSLSDNGRLNSALNTLTAQANAQQARQTAQQNQATAAQQNMQQALAQLSPGQATGLVSYQRIFSL